MYTPPGTPRSVAPVCTAAPASTIRSVTWRPCSGNSQDGLVVHDRADARAADVDERRRGLDGDRLLQRANAEHRIDRRRPAHLQHDARLHVGPESLERDLEPVRPGRQVRQQVAAGLIGHGRANEARVGLRHGDGHAGCLCGVTVTPAARAAFIANRTAQLRCPLRPGGAGGQQKDQKDQCAARTTGQTSLHDVNSSCRRHTLTSRSIGCGASRRGLAELRLTERRDPGESPPFRQALIPLVA